MRIEHVGLWVRDLEAAREFYARHFGCECGARYTNAAKGFSSYFLGFPGGARLELMTRIGLLEVPPRLQTGYAHLALAVDGDEAVRALTGRLRGQGVRVESEPRRTGDGYYESVVLDPEGNRIEIVSAG
jgi:lactoylglutathione lyase